ncbi:MAG TPA: hypothetical protein VLA91_00320 [Acidimicrobiia bacterium]|nr:hypothetical protein [Acidimicrobiia bacterium]
MTRLRMVVVALAAVAVIFVMAFTGPSPETEVTSSVTRSGGVCLQLEQWGLFGWVIRGQTYTETDLAEANWHTPASSNPPCEQAPIAEQEVRLPDGAAPDTYRLCGLADDLGCLQFGFTPAGAGAAP